ncbi:hypothetical protein A3A79_01940 [Candidatus Gottesmanbacteria bacterium RIFCSPLOWO2_01_FULL_43_11b]|uniref:Glycosyltransferase RgtA/B/C/D-like domain-containing protein n=1 Tax=Candidatus Gottesmanbacteria bacterium RIFCSPLOWO2_01_FULL_43_11b TaxID=1798392 RepID=A0A1F6AGY4_9BACT|nr:MAG: hypothetical protein A3A79_01940 [Candidatus Gottesmanbacteria bacterium RIFCSPLOWO2_01_FULL_43_11b]
MKKSLPAFGIIIVWLSISFLYSRDFVFISPGDGQRDAAIITNILSGNILGDPAYAGEHAWYPFLMHIYFAFIKTITNIPVQMLLSQFGWLAPLPSILLIALLLLKESRSWLFVSLGLLAFILFIPWTQEMFLLSSHPMVFSLGIVCLAFFTFSKTMKTGRWKYFFYSAISLALLVYSHTIASLSVAAGFTLYTLLTKKHLGKFIVMAILSFILTLPYLWPIISVYKLTPVNSSVYSFRGIYNANSLPEILNAHLYGFGWLRWVNTFFIVSGVIRVNPIILSVYFASFIMTLPSFIPSLPSFAPHDFQVFNHFVAIFLYVSGVAFWLKKVKKSLRPLVFFSFLALNIMLVWPTYTANLEKRHLQLITGNIKEPDWLAASNWINDNTKITDVIAATPDRSYFYVSGFTGRKVVATHNNFANAFVNQNKRLRDLYELYSTQDQEVFIQIARYYNISYIIASPYEASYVGLSNLNKFDSYTNLRKVFTSVSVSIYKFIESDAAK